MNESVNLLGPASEYTALAVLATHQNLVLLIATFGGMVLLLMLESLWPRRPSTDLSVGRWLNNWLLAYINFAAVLWLVHLAASSPWARSLAVKPGLLESLPPALAFLALLVVLEFGGYWLHRLFHASPFLWRFHAIHHLDTEVDVTTSHRHHTVEAVAGSLVFLPVFLLLACRPCCHPRGTRAANHCPRQSQQSCASRAGRPHAALVAGDSRFPSPASPQRPAVYQQQLRHRTALVRLSVQDRKRRALPTTEADTTGAGVFEGTARWTPRSAAVVAHDLAAKGPDDRPRQHEGRAAPVFHPRGDSLPVGQLALVQPAVGWTTATAWCLGISYFSLSIIA